MFCNFRVDYEEWSFDWIAVSKFILLEADKLRKSFAWQICIYIQLCVAVSLILLLTGVVVKMFPISKMLKRKKISKLLTCAAYCLKEIKYFVSSIKLIARNYFARRVFRISITILSFYWESRNERRGEETRSSRRSRESAWHLHNMGIAPEAKPLFRARLCACCSMWEDSTSGRTSEYVTRR